MSARGCIKSKGVKHKLEDQDDTGLVPDAEAAYASTACAACAADASTPATQQDRGTEQHQAGKSLLLPSAQLNDAKTVCCYLIYKIKSLKYEKTPLRFFRFKIV